MAEFLFPIAFNLLPNFREYREQANRNQGEGEHQRDQHVAALRIA